ncbi:MAG: hypothetical protein ACJ8DZ_13990 [Allosphingosinicella sp.]
MLAFLPLIGGVFGLKGKAAGIVGGIVAFMLLLGVFAGGWALIKHNIIATHDAKQDAANAKADRKADQKAAETRRVDDRRLTTEETQLEEVRENAKGLSAADRRRARYECIRLQQSARAEHRQPPACGRPAVSSGAEGPH